MFKIWDNKEKREYINTTPAPYVFVGNLLVDLDGRVYEFYDATYCHCCGENRTLELGVSSRYSLIREGGGSNV